MPAFTKSDRVEAFKFVLRNILEEENDSDIHKALDFCRCRDITSLMSVNESTLDGLYYMENNKKIPIASFHINLLKIFQAFIRYMQSGGQSFNNLDEWKTLDLDDFNDFHITLPSSTKEAKPDPVFSSTYASTSTHNAVNSFKRGNRRDPSLFKFLKDLDHWDNWWRNFSIQAKVQDCAEVLDSAYTPGSSEETELFFLKQQYIYSLF